MITVKRFPPPHACQVFTETLAEDHGEHSGRRGAAWRYMVTMTCRHARMAWCDVRGGRITSMSYGGSTVRSVTERYAQPSFAELGTPLRDGHVRRARPGDHRRRAGREWHHRGRRGQGPRRRTARRVRHPGQSRRSDPAVHHRADRHYRGHGRPRAAGGGGPATAAGVPLRRGLRRPQRPVRHRLPQGGLRPARLPVAESSRARHRRAGPSAAHRRRGRQLPARHARDALPHRHPPHAPGPGRRPGHGRGAARAYRPPRQPQDLHPGGGGRVRQGDVPGAAPQAPPRRGPARRAGRLHLPRRAATVRSMSARAARSPPGCAATSPPPRPASGSPK